MRSRHISSKTYKWYIKYRPDSTSTAGILGYCCKSANGLRTIGCRSHIAAIIYNRYHGRYLAKIIRRAEILSGLFSIEESDPIMNEDGDED